MPRSRVLPEDSPRLNIPIYPEDYKALNQLIRELMVRLGQKGSKNEVVRYLLKTYILSDVGSFKREYLKYHEQEAKD